MKLKGQIEQLLNKRLALPCLPEIRSVNAADRTIDFVASTEAGDRYGDIIRVNGWVLDNYKKNPVFLWQHQSQNPPIGACVDVKKEFGAAPALVQKIRFFSKSVYPFADTIFQMYMDHGLKAVSVGFMPLEQPKRIKDPENDESLGYEFTKQELFELSAVNIPANPEALARAMSKGLSEVEAENKFGKETLEELCRNGVYEVKGFFGDDNPPWVYSVPGITHSVDDQTEKKKDADVPTSPDPDGVACDRKGCGDPKSMHKKSEDGSSYPCTKAGCDCTSYKAPSTNAAAPNGELKGQCSAHGEMKVVDGELHCLACDRTVCPYRVEKLAPADAPWDAPAELGKQTKPSGWKRMSTVIVGDPSNKTSYKLPHHKGEGFDTVRRGVANALARLSNTTMASADRPGAKSHLSKHMKEFQADFDEIQFCAQLEELEELYSRALLFKKPEEAMAVFAMICNLCGADFKGLRIDLSMAERMAFGIETGVAEFREADGKGYFHPVTKDDDEMSAHIAKLDSASAAVHMAIGYTDGHANPKVKAMGTPLRKARTHIEKAVAGMRQNLGGNSTENPNDENGPDDAPTDEDAPNPGDGSGTLDNTDPYVPVPMSEGLSFEDMLTACVETTKA